MGQNRDLIRQFALAALVLVAGACASSAPATGPSPVTAPVGLPDVPSVRGPLAVKVAYPTPGAALPRVDSTFIFGSVGTGDATLHINGTPVPVAPNGAFLAYLPLPADGVWKLEASADGRVLLVESKAGKEWAPSPERPLAPGDVMTVVATRKGLIQMLESTEGLQAGVPTSRV